VAASAASDAILIWLIMHMVSDGGPTESRRTTGDAVAHWLPETIQRGRDRANGGGREGMEAPGIAGKSAPGLLSWEGSTPGVSTKNYQV
jgi:hypothetical protein